MSVLHGCSECLGFVMSVCCVCLSIFGLSVEKGYLCVKWLFGSRHSVISLCLSVCLFICFVEAATSVVRGCYEHGGMSPCMSVCLSVCLSLVCGGSYVCITWLLRLYYMVVGSKRFVMSQCLSVCHSCLWREAYLC